MSPECRPADHNARLRWPLSGMSEHPSPLFRRRPAGRWRSQRSLRCRNFLSVFADIGDCPLPWSHLMRQARRWQSCPSQRTPMASGQSGVVRIRPLRARIWLRAGGHRLRCPSPCIRKAARQGRTRHHSSWRRSPGVAGARPGRASVAAPGHPRGDLCLQPGAPGPWLGEGGDDGFMVWERWGPAADSDRAARIARLIAWILMGEAVAAAGSPR